MRRPSLPPRTRVRAPHALAAAAIVGVAAAAAVIAVRGTHHETVVPPRSAPHARANAGVVSLVDHTWRCRSRVDLALVRVVIHGGASRDAVHLDRGCTGTIRRLEVVGNGRNLGPGGDGVKIHTGAHDLRILGGVVDCGAKARGKHQDAIQVMGGERVVLEGISSRYCSNSFMFINSGAHRRGLPQAIRCVGCDAWTRNYSIFVGRSLDSGATGGRFRSRVRPRASGLAVRPVLVDNAWAPRT